MKWLIFLASLLPILANSASLYLCRSYGGGTFWASNHCNQHSALIERIVSVPDGMPFDQQVTLAEQQRQPTTTTNTYTNTVINNSAGPSKAAQCTALNGAITQFDTMARQPQSGQMQDWIAGEKKKARDRQFRLGC
jgi:hypothetical protein